MKKHDEEKINKEHEELKLKCDEYLNGWKRALADYQNLLKETSRQQSEFMKFANANLLTELLPIFDNFKSALNLIPETDKNNAWVIGFSHIKNQLAEFMKMNGVEEIKTVGEQFNPAEHEAVEQTNDADKPDNIIIQEKRSGYKLNTKIVQAARVVVNSKTPASADAPAGQASETSKTSETSEKL